MNEKRAHSAQKTKAEGKAEYSALEQAENLRNQKKSCEAIEKKKARSPKGREQANRAKKEKVLNGQFQFNQFFASGQQFGENFFITRTHAVKKTKYRKSKFNSDCQKTVN